MQTRQDSQRLETLLKATLEQLTSSGCPPRLASALRAAVLPGGQRLRPYLCLEVARAVAETPVPQALPAAAAIELIHCASLVHDDLPCFDNALLRRGQPTVQHQYGEALAVLAGDTLIMAAFELMAEACNQLPAAGPRLVQLLAQAAGAPRGLTSGQAWELETSVDLQRYHQFKTAALFEAAAVSGALTADPTLDAEPWRLLGLRLGEAYQILDDIRDVTEVSESIGKPAGQDRALGRPNIVSQVGLPESRQAFDGAVARALAAIPPCVGHEQLEALIGQLFARGRTAQAVSA